MKKIAVLGLGKVGELAAELLHNSGFTVTGIDKVVAISDAPFATKSLDLGSAEGMVAEFAQHDAVLSCLPYQLNVALAQAAHDAGVHYFDLTEDVPTTKAIIQMSKTATGLMAPQCGLAPGFVGIVGADLISQFDDCRSCKMRVGALPQNPKD